VRSRSDRRIFQLAQYLNPTKGGPIYRSALCVSSPVLDRAAACWPPARFIPLHFVSDGCVELQTGPASLSPSLTNCSCTKNLAPLASRIIHARRFCAFLEFLIRSKKSRRYLFPAYVRNFLDRRAHHRRTPVIDFLGAASPHGKTLPAFFAAFVAAMAAMRVLIAWFYEHTQSVALAQFMHISSTGSLVVFSPPAVTPTQEATWYAIYAFVLWLLVLLLTGSFPNNRRPG
jgi:hypothetical protein